MKVEIDPGRNIEVLHITDTHLAPETAPSVPPKSLADAAAMLNGSTTDETFERILESVSDVGFDLVLHTGDLLENADEAAYEKALDQLARLERPLLVSPGNHDDPAMLGAKLQQNGIERRCIDAGNWRIVVLDSNLGDQGGLLGEAELLTLGGLAKEWDGHVLVGLHHPPLSTCADPDCTLADADAFLDVVNSAGNVRAVASGHLHSASEAERTGVKYLLGPSTCLQLVHEHPLPEHNRTPTKGGLRRIQLLPTGEVHSTLQWI
ncbi:Icc protein [Labrenzia sp. EL_195]|nr:Icc protein [Labrenzia sp. EL_195]